MQPCAPATGSCERNLSNCIRAARTGTPKSAASRRTRAARTGAAGWRSGCATASAAGREEQPWRETQHNKHTRTSHAAAITARAPTLASPAAPAAPLIVLARGVRAPGGEAWRVGKGCACASVAWRDPPAHQVQTCSACFSPQRSCMQLARHAVATRCGVRLVAIHKHQAFLFLLSSALMRECFVTHARTPACIACRHSPARGAVSARGRASAPMLTQRHCMRSLSSSACGESSAGRTSRCMPMGLPGSGAAL